jgi:hypothetical protein
VLPRTRRVHASPACLRESPEPLAPLQSRPCGVGVGDRASRLRGHFFPHLAPPTLTWGFVVAILVTTMFGLALVEECGVQWGAVE